MSHILSERTSDLVLRAVAIILMKSETKYGPCLLNLICMEECPQLFGNCVHLPKILTLFPCVFFSPANVDEMNNDLMQGSLSIQ